MGVRFYLVMAGWMLIIGAFMMLVSFSVLPV